MWDDAVVMLETSRTACLQQSNRSNLKESSQSAIGHQRNQAPMGRALQERLRINVRVRVMQKQAMNHSFMLSP